MTKKTELLNQLTSCSKDLYNREELLSEMNSLTSEMVHMVCDENVTQISDLMKQIYSMNAQVGNRADQELAKLSKLSNEFENQVRRLQAGINGEEKAYKVLQRMKSNHIILQNLQLSDGIHQTEIDFLVLKQGVATIVEVKNYHKDVFIDDNGDLYKLGKDQCCEAYLGKKMEFRAQLIKEFLNEIGYEKMKIEKVVVFTNKYIHIRNEYSGFQVCFLSRLPYLIDDFYGTGVIQFTKHLQEMADYVQSKNEVQYFPSEMNVSQFKEAFVDAYIKIKGGEENQARMNIFRKVKLYLHSLMSKYKETSMAERRFSHV